MNKGITILARAVKMVDKDKGLFDLIVDDEEGGIVDGAHTAKIIEEANEEETTPDEQYVDVYMRAGATSEMIARWHPFICRPPSGDERRCSERKPPGCRMFR